MAKNIISTVKAKEICADWHGGQGSALYQFASSGVYTPANHESYLKEIAGDKKLAAPAQKKRLSQLESYFKYKKSEQKKQPKKSGFFSWLD